MTHQVRFAKVSEEKVERSPGSLRGGRVPALSHSPCLRELVASPSGSRLSLQARLRADGNCGSLPRTEGRGSCRHLEPGARLLPATGGPHHISLFVRWHHRPWVRVKQGSFFGSNQMFPRIFGRRQSNQVGLRSPHGPVFNDSRRCLRQTASPSLCPGADRWEATGKPPTPQKCGGVGNVSNAKTSVNYSLCFTRANRVNRVDWRSKTRSIHTMGFTRLFVWVIQLSPILDISLKCVSKNGHNGIAACLVR